MALKSPFIVQVQKPEASLSELMSEVRAWLDGHKIQPAEFKSYVAKTGMVSFDLRFQNEVEANLFEREFAQSIR